MRVITPAPWTRFENRRIKFIVVSPSVFCTAAFVAIARQNIARRSFKSNPVPGLCSKRLEISRKLAVGNDLLRAVGEGSHYDCLV